MYQNSQKLAAVWETMNREDLPAETRREHVENLRKDARNRLRRLQDKTDGDLNATIRSLQQKLNTKPKNETQELLFEVKRDRAWARLKAYFEYQMQQPDVSIDSLVRTEARRAALSGEVETLRALEEELPVFLRARGHTDQEMPYFEAMVDEALTATYTTSQLQARSDAEDLTKRKKRLSMAFEHAVQALEDDPRDERTIPGFADDELVEIQPVVIPEPNLPKMASPVGVQILDHEPK